MKIPDILLTGLLPTLILLHLLVAPYTKVEESFNLQATHDIIAYGTPTQDVGTKLRASYDHFEFPGAVPRSFVGAVVLAGVSRPIITVLGPKYAQFIVRAVLGMFNAFALLRYKNGVDKAFGKVTGRWFILLQASQFHVLFYASRTLPNMFAFGLTTLALREVLPIPAPVSRRAASIIRYRRSIYLFVLAGVIFRAEVAILLASNLIYLLCRPAISLQNIVPAGLVSAVIALGITIPIDSYFWQRPVWPELAGFFYNAVQGKSSEWGTSPFHAYFTSFLPKLLLNPMIPVLMIFAQHNTSTRRTANSMIIPSMLFIALYSIQPHKEARFIIYVVPPLTACAALYASYIWTHRTRTLLYRLASILLVVSIIASFVTSIAMLAISSLNYPGGEALWKLHQTVLRDGTLPQVRVHMDVLSCMTGVSRFQQAYPSTPFSSVLKKVLLYPTNTSTSAGITSQEYNADAIIWHYDKTESPDDRLLDPMFWAQFDYVLAERPEKVIGKWEIVDSVYAYAGIEFLRPHQERAGVGLVEAMKTKAYAGGRETANGTAALEVLFAEIEQLGIWALLREGTRRFVTRGWWVGPRMKEKIRVLKWIPPI